MRKEIILKKKYDTDVQAQLKILDISYIDKIIKLEREIYSGLENKEFYSCSSREEYEEKLNGDGAIVGCVNLENDELVAIGAYVEYGYREHNYGYDFGIDGKELLKVAQIESTIVLNDYRGNKLQKIMCEALEEMAINNKMKIISATVAPYNKFSLNTFKNLGYNIVADKLKYGGLRRYVLMKELKRY